MPSTNLWSKRNRASSQLYFDYAAATPLDRRVGALVSSIEKTIYGNPSSVHGTGQKAAHILEDSRFRIAQVLKTRPEAIVFTSSGTEANNLALFGVRHPLGAVGHMLISSIEHHSVIRAAEQLRSGREADICYLPVRHGGHISSSGILDMIRPDTRFISVGYANNEIGVVQSLGEISKMIRDKFPPGERPLLHSDACQAAGYLDLDVHRLGVDFMTLSAAKIYGPKGIGCLFVKPGLDLAPMIFGGDQERGRRAGTINPALAAGFALALEIAEQKRKKESQRLYELREYLIDAIVASIPDAILNGDRAKRLPNNINFSFKNIEGEMLMLALDMEGIAVSTGAACTLTSTDPSHVLQALGTPQEYLLGNIRITIGRQTTKKDVGTLLAKLKIAVQRLRQKK